MGRARKILAFLRRRAREPGSSVIAGTATGAAAGVLAVTVSPMWLILALVAPLGRRLIEGSAVTDPVEFVDEGGLRAAPVAETVTETASDKDWMAVGHGAADSLLAPGAQDIRTSRSDKSDVEGSYVEF